MVVFCTAGQWLVKKTNLCRDNIIIYVCYNYLVCAYAFNFYNSEKYVAVHERKRCVCVCGQVRMIIDYI